MASAIFVAPFQVGLGPVLPPMQAEGVVQICYTDVKGVLCGGYSCIGHVPQAPTCLVRVWSDEAGLDALAALPDMLYVCDVVEAPDVS